MNYKKENYVKSDLINMTPTWVKEKSEFQSGIEPMTS